MLNFQLLFAARHPLCCPLPSRELAQQTYRVVQQFVADLTPRADGSTLSTMLMVGGTDVAADIDACVTAGCNIVVATPGRLLDMMTRLQSMPDHHVTFKVRLRRPLQPGGGGRHVDTL